MKEGKIAKVIIPNKKDYENRITRIIEAGADNLHVISDFDRTLTKAFVNGEKTPSIISILRKEDYLGEDYTEKAYALAEKYRPIEDDPKCPISKKKEKMNEWWQKHFDLLIKSQLNKSHIKRVAQSDKIEFRPYIDTFLGMLNDLKIPLVIFSASGLGSESINEMIQAKNLAFENIFTISNSFNWDDQGYLKGVNEPIIHSYNKDEGVLYKFPEVAEVVEDRKNIILIGDSLGDADMAKGFSFDNLIKIGFLNENVEELLPKYEELYDVIITGDADAEFLVKLFEEFEVKEVVEGGEGAGEEATEKVSEEVTEKVAEKVTENAAE